MDEVPVMLTMPSGKPEGTTIWASEKVIGLIHGNDGGLDATQWGRFKSKLQSFCDANFKLFMPEIIKRECGKTFGVHVGHFRIAGFFDNGYADFIALDWFVKKAQRNDKRMNALYQKVDSIREAGSWIKIE
jgi:hypothetical protein